MSNRKKLVLFIIAAAILGSSGSVFAATFYIIREQPQAPCKVVEGHPPATVTIIGGNKMYATRDQAEKDMALACKTG